MTPEEVIQEALGRLRSVTDEDSLPRPSLYRQIGRRQQRLFARAAQVAPEYFGVWADADLDADYRIDLRDLEAPIPKAVRVRSVEILDPGSSHYREGHKVNIVRQANLAGQMAPRVTVSDHLIEGVEEGTIQDLEGVTSLRVYYPKMTDELDGTDGGTELELEAPWDELLVLDTAMHILRRARTVDPNIKAAELSDIRGEYNDLYAEFDDQLERFVARVGVPPVVF